MLDLIIVSNGLGVVLFVALGVVLAFNWRGGRINIALAGACLSSVGFFAGQLAYHEGYGGLVLRDIHLLEVLRDGAWFAAIISIVRVASAGSRGLRDFALPGAVLVLIVFQLLVVFSAGAHELISRSLGPKSEPIFLGFLLLAIAGLVLVEVLFRNTRPDQRWAVKLLCFGVGGFFAYDVYLYAEAVLFNAIDPDIWHARGLVNAITVPMLAVAIVRNPHWRAELFVSRQVLFHSTAVMLVGIYLLLMAIAGYIIKQYGGSWGGALQTAFLFGAVLVLVVLMLSSQVRAQVKVFLAKHFYRNKYDYREQWLNFTRNLAECEGDRDAIEQTILRMMTSVLDCRWGYLWLQGESGNYLPVAQCNVGALAADVEEAFDSDLVVFMRAKGWVVDLDEYAALPDVYEGLDSVPHWLAEMSNAWLLVPLPQGERLLGFLVLSRALVNQKLEWEDRDLLKTAAMQAGAYLALLGATDELAESRQFDAYNRLSAYIVHDLKNVTAQLSLLLSNSEKHRDNPEFIDDVFKTVESSVDRMNRMLVNLRSGKTVDERSRRVDLVSLINEAVHGRKLASPTPVFNSRLEELYLVVEPTRLAKALEHLITNAQEATPDEGEVILSLSRQGDSANIEVRDTGIGMEAAFIRNDLFRPFVTTKGNAGMGIGVYETRQIITEAGGELYVDSVPGQGTTFTIQLPLNDQAELESIESTGDQDGAG